MDLHWQKATRHKLRTVRQRLDALLTDAGLNIVGGCDLFRLVETEDAGRLWRSLAERGVYVRRFDWSDQLLRFGLPSGHKAERRLKDALNL
jgi:cobalamin biosynthetic protein CobC